MFSGRAGSWFDFPAYTPALHVKVLGPAVAAAEAMCFDLCKKLEPSSRCLKGNQKEDQHFRSPPKLACAQETSWATTARSQPDLRYLAECGARSASMQPLGRVLGARRTSGNVVRGGTLCWCMGFLLRNDIMKWLCFNHFLKSTRARESAPYCWFQPAPNNNYNALSLYHCECLFVKNSAQSLDFKPSPGGCQRIDMFLCQASWYCWRHLAS